jgi:hypothetical protein
MMKSLKIFAVILVGLTTQATPTVAQECNLYQSVYSDVDNKGFELVFSKGRTNSASIYATAIIEHPTLGTIWSFDVTQSQGYGTTFLLNNKINPRKDSYAINFFNQRLESDRTFSWRRRNTAPVYAFISGLGSDDYYRRRSSNLFLLDTMWVHKRCQ